MARQNPRVRTIPPEDTLVLTADEAERLARLESLARLLDSRFTVPGTGIRFGLDSVLGLLPGVGDTVGLVLAGYLIREAHALGAPLSLKLKMLRNVGIDWLTGTVPLVGDLFDVGWKANARNVRLLREHLFQQARPRPPRS